MSFLVFAREFLRHPTQLGAVAPSGVELARLMVDAADIGTHHVVAELGAGTGSMTGELVDRIGSERLMVLEPNEALASILRERFQGLQVLERLAEDLVEIAEGCGHTRVDRVVSGLPWAIWPEEVQRRTLGGITRAMAQDGRFVTFAYAHAAMLPAARRLRRTLESQFRAVRRTPIAWANVPPAFVYVCDGPRPGGIDPT